MPAAATKRYEIHHNGGRPFVVAVTASKKELTITETATGHDVGTTKYVNIWLAKKTPGHSVLAELPTGEFLFISQKVLVFRLAKDDAPVKFVSQIGNSDVVYAYLVGHTHTYFLLEQKSVPNEYLSLKKDVYPQFYGFVEGPAGPVPPRAKKYRARVLAHAE